MRGAADRTNRAAALTLRAGAVEVPLAAPHRSAADGDWRLVPAARVRALNAAVRARGGACVRVLEEMREFKVGIYAAQWEAARLDMAATDAAARVRDLQLLRATSDLNQARAAHVCCMRYIHLFLRHRILAMPYQISTRRAR